MQHLSEILDQYLHVAVHPAAALPHEVAIVKGHVPFAEALINVHTYVALTVNARASLSILRDALLVPSRLAPDQGSPHEAHRPGKRDEAEALGLMHDHAKEATVFVVQPRVAPVDAAVVLRRLHKPDALVFEVTDCAVEEVRVDDVVAVHHRLDDGIFAYAVGVEEVQGACLKAMDLVHMHEAKVVRA